MAAFGRRISYYHAPDSMRYLSQTYGRTKPGGARIKSMASFADLVDGRADLDQLVVTNNSPILISAPRAMANSRSLGFHGV